MDSYTATFTMTFAEDAAHAAAMLDHHADLHSAFASTRADRGELMLTLPAENLRVATETAFALLHAIAHRDIRRVEVSTSDDHDRRRSVAG